MRGGRLEEQRAHGPPGEGRFRLGRAVAAGGGEHCGEVGVGQVGDGAQVTRGGGHRAPAAADSRRISSRSSTSARRTADPLVGGGRQVLADEIGADRQLPVAAVHECAQLHGGGTAEGDERVERGPHGPAGVDDVVGQHDDPVVDHRACGQRRGLGGARPVVAEPGGVHDDRRDGGRFDLADHAG